MLRQDVTSGFLSGQGVTSGFLSGQDVTSGFLSGLLIYSHNSLSTMSKENSLTVPERG